MGVVEGEEPDAEGLVEVDVEDGVGFVEGDAVDPQVGDVGGHYFVPPVDVGEDC